jgi:succinate dehydrogenase/fumarate reductase-like Fe-S protein
MAQSLKLGTGQMFTMAQVDGLIALYEHVLRRVEAENRALKAAGARASALRQSLNTPRYRTESQQGLACVTCGQISCRCGVPSIPGLTAIVALQAKGNSHE